MARQIKTELVVKDKGSAVIKKFSDVTSSGMAKLAGIVGVGAVTAAFTALMKKTIDYGDKLHKLNLRLGVNVQEMDKLRQIADLSGVSFQALSIGMQRATRRIQDAAAGGGVAADALKELGLNAKELVKLSPDEQFKVIAERLETVASQSKKVALAFKLFDSEGVSVLQMTKDLNKQLEGTNSQMDQDKATQMANFNDALTKIMESFRQLAIKIFPAVTAAMEAMSTAWDYWAKKFADPKPKEKLAALNKELERLLDARKQRELEGFGDVFLKDIDKKIEAKRKQIELLNATIADTPTGGAKSAPSGLIDPSLAGQVRTKAESDADAKILSLRETLNEQLKQLEADRLTFNGQSKEAEILLVQDKYAKMQAEAQGNAEILKMIEEAMNQELALINDNYRKSEGEKRQAELDKRIADSEKIAGEERKRQNEVTKKLVDDFQKQEEERKKVIDDTKEYFSSNFGDMFASIATGSQKAGDAFKGMLTSMLGEMTKMLMNKVFMQFFNYLGGMGGGTGNSIFGAIGGMLSGKAAGGSVSEGKSVIVGERGPEIFTPNQSGKITPNNRIGGGGIAVNVNMNVGANSGMGDPTNANKVGQQLAQMVKHEIKNVISNEQRFGGMLYGGQRRYA